MRVVFILILLAITFSSSAEDQGGIQYLSAAGGQLSLTFYHGNVLDSGLQLEGAHREDFQHDRAVLNSPGKGGINFRANDGYFTQLEDGYLPLDTGLRISANGFSLDSSQLHITPKEFTRDTLLLSDQQGMDWFYLDYGHYERQGQWLIARFLDMRITRELASRLGDPNLQGHIVGFATLETRINEQPGVQLGNAETCPVETPNWPTQDGFDADVAMLDLESVNQIAREGGRVALAPSAYFENIGSADIPWFSQFADTRNVDACCIDQGDGVCAPYGNDQGGLLVYALYRFVDGRLEQLGQSQVKHAFNSVNMDTAAGSLPCRTPDHSGRIIPSGCEDLYQVNTNALQSYLGPRDEIIAHTGVWLRAGSIWDQTGPEGGPDGNCDYMPDYPLYGGQVPCAAPVTGVMDRRLSVSETDLTTPGARYFIEAWYLARDDINILNSFGHKEIKPAFTAVWAFPDVAQFQQGPVIEEFVALQNANAGSLVDSVISDEGQLRVSSSVSGLGADQWQYDISLMNLDFDRAIKGFDIPVPGGVNISMVAFFDGDSDPGNNWEITVSAGSISFRAQDDASLKWGSLVSFRFVADRQPAEVTATLLTAEGGSPDSLQTTTFSPLDLLFEDSFE